MGRYSGEGGLFEYVEKRLKEDGHMVIVIAEGAGQDILDKDLSLGNEKDASGNKLLADNGLWISQKIKAPNTTNSICYYKIVTGQPSDKLGEDFTELFKDF